MLIVPKRKRNQQRNKVNKKNSLTKKVKIRVYLLETLMANYKHEISTFKVTDNKK